ncbi:MAG: META domain-containing protein [Alphaproteobacteria bacterium]|nr:META domain-containing protein [Alphaproteobacteria bacterium]
MTINRCIALTLTLALASCEASVNAGSEQNAIDRHDWLAQSIDGVAVSNPERVTLSLANGTVSGRGGCNQYSGPVEYGNGHIKTGPLISTKMACAETGLMQLEQKFLGALQTASTYTVSVHPELTITTADGPLIFRVSPRQSPP